MADGEPSTSAPAAEGDGADGVAVEDGPIDDAEAGPDSESAARHEGDEEQQASACAHDDAQDEVADDAGEGAVEEYYPMKVVTPSGAEVELQVTTYDQIFDIRQILLDSVDTCFYTCYELTFNDAEGNRLTIVNEYVELSELGDVVAGLTLYMVDGLYDDRGVRDHISRLRELVSLDHYHHCESNELVAEAAVAAAVPTAAAEDGGKARNGRPIVPELESLGFLGETTGLLPAIAPRAPPEVEPCLRSVSISHWNPPPSYRRLAGDLIYLDVVTVEGRKLSVTAHTHGFYVNRSSGTEFDPAPAKLPCASSTLVGLLSAVSAGFFPAFARLLERKSESQAFDNIATVVKPQPWLDSAPPGRHSRDAGRAEAFIASPYGTEPLGIERDWNEELQSLRDLDKATSQQRTVRDRALFKTYCDFVEAAERGAKAVVGRNVPPMNPADQERYHLYVYNHIFFSFAVDASVPQPPPPLPHEATCAACAARRAEALAKGEEPPPSSQVPINTVQGAFESEQATYASSNNDLRAIRQLMEAELPDGLYTLAQAIVDYRGYRVVAQSIIPGILHGDKSSALKYGSVNGGKKINFDYSFHAKMLEVGRKMHFKESTVVGEDGADVTICGPVDCKGIVGSDNRQYLLDLVRMAPRDLNWDGDAHRFSVLRPELVEQFVASRTAAPTATAGAAAAAAASAAAALTEAVAGSKDNEAPAGEVESSVGDAAAGGKEAAAATEEKPDGSAVEAKRMDTGGDGRGDGIGDDDGGGGGVGDGDGGAAASKAEGEAAEAAAENSGEAEAAASAPAAVVAFNLNAKTAFRLGGSEAEKAADEELCVAASAFLKGEVLPKFIAELNASESTPYDGPTLVEYMHQVGINVRYLGEIAARATFTHVRQAAMVEMVVRTFKHEAAALLRATDDASLAHALAHLLNCLLGALPSPEAADEEPGAPAEAAGKERAAEAAPGEADGAVGGASASTKKKKKKKGGAGAAAPATTSGSADAASGGGAAADGQAVAAAEPANVDAAPVNPMAPAVSQEVWQPTRTGAAFDLTRASLWEAIRAGVKERFRFELPEGTERALPRLPLLRGACLALGVVIVPRAYNLEEERPFTAEDVRDLVARVKHTAPCSADARDLLTAAKEKLSSSALNEAYELLMEVNALLQPVTGPFHKQVALCNHYLGLVHYQAGNLEEAIAHVQRELVINERVMGLDHPTTATSYTTLGLFYHRSGKVELALKHLRRALQLLVAICGPDHPDLAATFIHVATMYQEAGRPNMSLRYLQEALKLSERLLGKDHMQTASAYSALAQAFSAMGNHKLAVQHQKNGLAIVEAKFGEADPRTVEFGRAVQSFQKLEAQAGLRKQQHDAILAAAAQQRGKPPTREEAEALAKLLNIPGGWHGLRAAQAAVSQEANKSRLEERKKKKQQQQQQGQGQQQRQPLNRHHHHAASAPRSAAAAAAGASTSAAEGAVPRDLKSLDDMLAFINGVAPQAGAGTSSSSSAAATAAGDVAPAAPSGSAGKAKPSSAPAATQAPEVAVPTTVPNGPQGLGMSLESSGKGKAGKKKKAKPADGGEAEAAAA